MDLLRRHVGGGRVLQVGGVEGRAVLEAPDARVVDRGGPHGLQGRDLPVEGGADLGVIDLGRLGAVAFPQALGAGAAIEGTHQVRLVRAGADRGELAQGDVQQEVRRHDPLAHIVAEPVGIGVQHRGETIQASQVVVGVLGRGDGVLLVQEVGQVGIGAGDRRDHVAGRREAVSAANVQIEDRLGGLRHIEHGIVIDRVHARELFAIQGLETANPVEIGGLLLGHAGGGNILQLRLQAGVRALVEG